MLSSVTIFVRKTSIIAEFSTEINFLYYDIKGKLYILFKKLHFEKASYFKTVSFGLFLNKLFTHVSLFHSKQMTFWSIAVFLCTPEQSHDVESNTVLQYKLS